MNINSQARYIFIWMLGDTEDRTTTNIANYFQISVESAANNLKTLCGHCLLQKHISIKNTQYSIPIEIRSEINTHGVNGYLERHTSRSRNS